MLKRARGIYSIPEYFPIEILEGGSAYYPGEHAHIDYKHDDRNAIHSVRIQTTGRFSEGVLFHELAHLRLRFMHVPVYMVSPDMPSWIVFFLVVHDEYYTQLVFDRFAPDISRRHFREAARRLPSLERFRAQLQHIPPQQDPRLYEGLVSIVGGEISRFVCRQSPNLWDYRAAFDSRAKIVRKSALSPYAERLSSALLSLPPLPPERFSPEDEVKITEFINKVMKIIFDKGPPLFKPANYSFQYP